MSYEATINFSYLKRYPARSESGALTTPGITTVGAGHAAVHLDHRPDVVFVAELRPSRKIALCRSLSAFALRSPLNLVTPPFDKALLALIEIPA